MDTDDTADRHATLVVLTGGNFSQVGVRLLLGATVPLVLLEFETTKSSVGAALTGMWGLYALLQFPSGVLADRYGERSVLIVGLGATVGGSLLVALSPSLLVYGVFVLVLGAGTGLYFAPATALVSRLYEEHGWPLGTLTGGSAVAGVVFPIAGGTVSVRFGWRIAVALAGVVALPVLLATERLVPRTQPANPDRNLGVAVDADRLRELLTRPGIAYTTSLAVVTAFYFQAFSSFFPTFLVEYRGLDPGRASLLFGAVFGIASVSQIVAGRVSDAFSRDLAIGASVALSIAGLTILLVAPGRVGLFAGIGVLGLGISWPGPLQARIVDHLGPDERGYGHGLVRSVYMLLASSGSVVVGTLAEIGGWVVAFGSVAGLLVGCVLLLVVNRALGLDL